jgi:hypothetical protein
MAKDKCMNAPQVYIDSAFDAFNQGFAPYVEKKLQDHFGDTWLDNLHPSVKVVKGQVYWDTQALTNTCIKEWQNIFRPELGNSGRSLVGEIKDWRNEVAHRAAHKPLTIDDAYRAVDTILRLLILAQLPQSQAVDLLKNEIKT